MWVSPTYVFLVPTGDPIYPYYVHEFDKRGVWMGGHSWDSRTYDCKKKARNLLRRMRKEIKQRQSQWGPH